MVAAALGGTDPSNFNLARLKTSSFSGTLEKPGLFLPTNRPIVFPNEELQIVCVRAADSEKITLTDSLIAYVEFPSIGTASKEKHFRDQQTQIFTQVSPVTSQTQFTLMKTNSTSYEHQTLSRDAAARQWNHPKLVTFFEKVMPMIEQALMENTLWDLFRED